MSTDVAVILDTVDLTAVHARMRTAVETAEPGLAPLYDALRYHLGWASPSGEPQERRAAKGIRPRACLLACEAVGGEPDQAASCAAAIELTHEFSLIHDDIQDGDRERRGRASLWTRIGIPQAINAGDLLWAIARSELSDAPVAASVLRQLITRYDEACVALAQGQYLDLDFETRSAVSTAEYRRMVEGKTGALLGLSTALGALVGGAEEGVVRRMHDAGRAMGVAFQMRDDWLGLWGDPERTGKPAGADLMRRKKSLPVLMALEEPSTRDAMAALLARETIDAASAGAMVDALRAQGMADLVARAASEEANRAVVALEAMDLRARPCSSLLDLARLAGNRDR